MAKDMKKDPNRARENMGEKGFALKDGAQAPTVKPINTNAGQYDLGRVKYNSVGSKGYPEQAFAYEY
jgi:hypothetical protein